MAVDPTIIGSERKQNMGGQWGLYEWGNRDPETGQRYERFTTGDQYKPEDTTPTVSDLKKSGINFVPRTDPYLDELKTGAEKTIDPEAIRKQEMDAIQEQIKAIKAIYANEMVKVRKEGQGRLGQQGALNARSGLIGSDYGQANREKVIGFNNEIEGNVSAREQAEISALFSKAQDRASERLKLELAQKKMDRDEYLRQKDKFTADARADLATYAQSGISFDNLDEATKKLLGEQTGYGEAIGEIYKKLGQQTKKTVELNGALYEQQSDGSYKLVAGGSSAKSAAPIEVSPGASLYDPNTGKFIGTAPMKPEGNKPTVQEVGNTLLQYDSDTNTWKPVFQGQSSSSASNKLDTSVQTINGKKVLIDNQTGAVIRELGSDYDPEIGLPSAVLKQIESSPEAKNLQAMKDFKNKLTAYRKEAERPEGFDSTGTRKSILDQLYADLKISYKEAANLGALTGPDLSILQEAIKPMSGVTNYPGYLASGGQKGVLNSIDNAIKTLETKSQDNYDSLISKYSKYKDDPYIQNLGQVVLGSQNSSQQGSGNYSQKIQGALQSGYQPSEIINFLKADPALSDKINRALQSGYSPEEILKTVSSFNSDLSTSQNYLNTDVSKIKDFSRVDSVIGKGVATGITGGSPVWKWGLDFVVDGGRGAPVKAPFNGKVVFAGQKGGFGNSVRIELDNGDQIWLSHLDGIDVKPGQKINSGMVIGTQGNTGTVLGKGGKPNEEARKKGSGTHVDITMRKPNGSYYTSQQVASILGVHKI